MSELTDDRLLPCPFCGCSDIVASNVGEEEDNWYVGCMESDCGVNPGVFCPDSEAEAIAIWNRRAAASTSTEGAGVKGLMPEDVEWVVNDIAELGVKIGNQFFFLYKGYSLVYGWLNPDPTKPPTHDDGTPMHWRPVFKREFGECAHPINYKNLNLIGTVSLGDSDEWKPIPAALNPPAPKVTTDEAEERG